jgi:hypothetical protein
VGCGRPAGLAGLDVDDLVVLVIGDGCLVALALHALDRRADQLPDAQRQDIHGGRTGRSPGARLVADLVLVDVGAAAFGDRRGSDRAAEMHLDLAARRADPDCPEIRVVAAAHRHADGAGLQLQGDDPDGSEVAQLVHGTVSIPGVVGGWPAIGRCRSWIRQRHCLPVKIIGWDHPARRRGPVPRLPLRQGEPKASARVLPLDAGCRWSRLVGEVG